MALRMVDALHGTCTMDDEDHRGDFGQQVTENFLSLSCTADMVRVAQIRAHGSGVADYVRFQDVVNVPSVQTGH